MIVLLSWILSIGVEAKESISSFSKPVQIVVRNIVRLPKIKKGKNFKLWMPLPRETKFQHMSNFSIQSKYEWAINFDEKYNNKMLFVEGTTISKKPVELIVSYVVERHPASVEGTGNIHFAGEKTPVDLYVRPNKLVPLADHLRKEASKASTEKAKSKKMRDYYDYAVKKLEFVENGEKVGSGDAVWMCDVKKGNCNDYHSLIIGMSRINQIPARSIMGLGLPFGRERGELRGHHCWASVYDEEQKAWLYLDATDGQREKRPNEFYGKLPTNRIELTYGRDIVLNPKQNSAPLNYFNLPHLEVQGKVKELKTLDMSYEVRKL